MTVLESSPVASKEATTGANASFPSRGQHADGRAPPPQGRYRASRDGVHYLKVVIQVVRAQGKLALVLVLLSSWLAILERTEDTIRDHSDRRIDAASFPYVDNE